MSIRNRIESKINAIIKRSHWYKERTFQGCEKFWNLKTFDLDVINLGSTASFYGFDYRDIDLKCANFALNGQYLLADLAILKNYSSYIKPGATVILAACLFPLDGYDVTYFDDRYYTFLYPSSIWNYSSKRHRLIEDIRRNPLKYYPAYSLLTDFRTLFSRTIVIQMPDDRYKENARIWMENIWAKEFSIDNYEAPLSLRNEDLKRQSISILKEIQAFCYEKGLNLVIVTPPVTPELRQWLTPLMRHNYLYAYQNSGLFEKVQFINYVDDVDFDDHKYFRDAYLLNDEGARLFTKKVLTDLKLLK